LIYQFRKHYTRDEARELLPQLREWLDRLCELRAQLQTQDKSITALLEPGRDIGGELVNAWVRTLAELRVTLAEFYHRDIQIKDLDRGLVDFPAILDGKEVFLCWEKSEPDVGFFHDLETGFAGRQPFEDD